MKNLTKRLAVFGLASCFAVPALAADPVAPREKGVDVNVGGNGVQVKVKNAEGKDLGKINDIVIDTNNGNVRYAAMSFGGFLGLGDKMFALPWDALRMKKTDDSVYLVLNVTKEKLENAPGFDQDTWPDFANAEMTGKLDAYYGTQRERRPNAPNANRVRRDNDRDTTRNAVDSTTPMGVYRVSQINSMTVYDAQNESIADIQDVVIDIDQGKVRYVAVAFNDSWGYGEKLFAMPWKAFAFKTIDDQTKLVLNVNKAQLR